MNKVQATNLFVAVLSFLAAIVVFFFAATDNKHTMVFLVMAVFWILVGTVWVYLFVKARRAL